MYNINSRNRVILLLFCVILLLYNSCVSYYDNIKQKDRIIDDITEHIKKDLDQIFENNLTTIHAMEKDVLKSDIKNINFNSEHQNTENTNSNEYEITTEINAYIITVKNKPENTSQPNLGKAHEINEDPPLGTTQTPSENNLISNSTQQTHNEMNSNELDFVIINNIIYYKKDYSPEQLQTIMEQNKNRKFMSLKHTNAAVLKQVNYSKYSKEDRNFLKSRQKIYVNRAKTVKKACVGHPELKTSTNVKLVWDVDHDPKLVWCPQYKVASTSWMMNFLKLKHFNEDNEKLAKMKKRKKEKLQYTKSFGASHGQVYDLYPQPADNTERQHLWRESVRFIIVRHPFTRLLSAYRDKMTKKDPKPAEFHFRKLQLEIIKKYRSSRKENKSPFPTFPEFVDYVIHYTKGFKTPSDWNKKVVCWVPYWAQCGVCSSDYSIIMKLETMADDERYIITLAGLTELKQEKQHEWRHLRNVSSTDAANDYYRQLNKNQIMKLYEGYKPDFELFDYKIDEYLKIAKN